MGLYVWVMSGDMHNFYNICTKWLLSLSFTTEMAASLYLQKSRKSRDLQRNKDYLYLICVYVYEVHRQFYGVLIRSPEQGSMPNGYSLYSTSTGNEVVSRKQGTKQGEKATVVKAGDPEEQVADTKILRTLVKYLWMKDNPEFRWRVIAALGFLVGGKVGAIFCNFLLFCSALIVLHCSHVLY